MDRYCVQESEIKQSGCDGINFALVAVPSFLAGWFLYQYHFDAREVIPKPEGGLGQFFTQAARVSRR